MKNILLLTAIGLFVITSCNSTTEPNVQPAHFGIYETGRGIDIPASVMDSLQAKNVSIEQDMEQPIIGYFPENDSITFNPIHVKDAISILKTAIPVGKEGKRYGIVAVKGTPLISNADIQHAKGSGLNVVIYFNLSGARKWAEITGSHLGQRVAFVIDDLVYSLPLINAEIKEGAAVIAGLKNETVSENIARSLNMGIEK